MKKIILFFIFFWIQTASAATLISEIQIKGELTTPKERILNLLPFKTGELYLKEKLDQGIQYLKEWGIFSEVQARTKQTSAGTLIEIDLNEALIIGEMNIAGNYPYIKTKIRKRLNLQVGDSFNPQKIDEQKGRIKSFYEKMGYFNTTVETEMKPASIPNTVILIFHIIKGERIRYRKVAFTGANSFPQGRLHTYVHQHGLYSEKRLREALKAITQFYRHRGFLKAKAKITSLRMDPKANRVDVEIEIQEGPKVQVFFRGKKPYRIKTLKEIITIYEEGNFDVVELENSVQAILKRLRHDGYAQAKVSFKKEKLGEKERYNIFFFLKPGIKTYVTDIRFSGNEFLSSKKLKNQILTKERSLTQKGILRSKFLKEDPKILKEYYQSEGFAHVEVKEPSVTFGDPFPNYVVTFPITEGSQVLVEKITFSDPSFSAKEILKSLVNQEKKPLNETYLPIDQKQVELFYHNHGYPYVEVKQEVNIHETEATIHYKITPNERVIIGDIFFVGDILTSVKPMLQAVKIKKGEAYSEQKIIQASLNLRRLSVFRTVNIETIGLQEKQKVVFLRIQVEERRPFVLDVEAKYSTDEQVEGTLKFTNYNSFGWAKQTRLLFTGGIKRDRVELSWVDPRFAASEFQMNLSSWLDYRKKTVDTLLQAGGAIGFFRQWGRFSFLSRYELTRNYTIEGQSLDPSALRDSTLSQITFSGSFDHRNSFSDPTKGYFVLGSTDILNEIGGPQANFAKLKLATNYFYSPLQFLTFSNHFRLNRIQDIGTNVSIPTLHLFKLGGDDTLRGFKEDRAGPQDSNGNPVGGRLRFVLNSELALRLTSSFQVASFYDLGSLTNSFAAMNSRSIRHSYGFGLRYVTPVGPIRADYGMIIDRAAGENFGRFHLTFGYPF